MANLAERHTEVLDGARDLVVAAWQPAQPNEVIRDYFLWDELDGLEGMKVFVFGPEDGAREVERLNRAEKVHGFKVSARLVKRFTDPGRPTREWLDRCVRLVGTVYDALDKDDPGDYLLGSLWAQTLEIPNVSDFEWVQQNKVFYAEIDGEFRELVTG